MNSITYNLTGHILLKSEVKEKADKINTLVQKTEEKVLKSYKNVENLDFQGNYTLEDNKIIKVEITNNHVPSHMIFYRIRKGLAQTIGRKLHIGIDELVIDTLLIKFPLDQVPQDGEDITVPFIKSIKINEEEMACEIELEKIDSDFVISGSIERIMKRIEEKIALTYYEGKAEAHKIIYESGKKDISFDLDPTKEMVNKNWISRASTKGKWVYWAPAVAMFNAMEKIVIEHLLKPLNFQEVINSNIVSGEDVWLKTGHLGGMPMELYYVAEPATRNVKKWDTFVDKVKITQQVPYDELKKMVQLKPLKGLTYAQCPALYWTLKGKTIDENTFPIYIFERTNNSFRYEAGGRHGIERVDEFHRIEVVFIGKPETLINLHEEVLKKYRHIFNDILELEWRMATVTPFYQQQAGDIFDEDKADKDIKVGTIDYEAWLPYRGNRDESEWLEFQNISIVGEKYIDAFNIKHQKGDQLWSGCTGIGLERWIAVFLAQHGFDTDNWPEEFKKYLPEIPKPLKFL